MKRISPIRLVTTLLIILFTLFLATQTEAREDDTFGPILNRLQDQGTYHFTADIEQTLIPRAIPEMMGRSDERVDMHIEAAVDVPKAYTRLTLIPEGDGVPIAIEQKDGEFYLLQGGERTAIQNPLGISSSTGDYTHYLQAAENIQVVSNSNYPAYQQYLFDIDGVRLADWLHQQIQAANPSKRIPITPSMVQNVSGQGELWVDAQTLLPRRQIVDLTIPEIEESYDAHVHIIVDYTYTAATTKDDQATTGGRGHRTLPVERTHSPTVIPISQSSTWATWRGDMVMILFALLLTITLLQFSRRIWFRRAIVTVIIVLLVGGPMGQVWAQQKQRVSQPTLAEVLGGGADEDSDTAATVRSPEQKRFNHMTSSHQYKNNCLDLYTPLDSDSDGLNDFSETCYGTDPYYADTDRDGIEDYYEVTPFYLVQEQQGDVVTTTMIIVSPTATVPTTATLWIGDPIAPDSNYDGLADNQEYPADIGDAAHIDVDGDMIPNMWDEDNDGDGVNDKEDLDPATFFTVTTSFSMTIQPTQTHTGYFYVSVQVRPRDPSHLRYATTVLDWPADSLGSLQDLNDSTEDLYFIPALKVTDATSQTKYMELAKITDGSQIVAFTGEATYGPEQQEAVEWRDARFVWIAYMNTDQDESEEDDSEATYDEETVVAEYEEPHFIVTGIEIAQVDSYQYTILGTPDLDDDDVTLFKLLNGLHNSWLQSTTWDMDTIATRFGEEATGLSEATWQINPTDVALFQSEVFGELRGGQDQAKADINTFLDEHYPVDEVALLLTASERTLGSQTLFDVNEDAFAQGILSFDLGNIITSTNRHLQLNVYEYDMVDGWSSVVAPDKLVELVETRYAASFAQAQNALQAQFPDINEVAVQSVTMYAFLTWTLGASYVVQIDVEKADGVVEDGHLSAFVNSTVGNTLAEYLIGVDEVGVAGAGLVWDSTLSDRYAHLREAELNEYTGTLLAQYTVSVLISDGAYIIVDKGQFKWFADQNVVIFMRAAFEGVHNSFMPLLNRFASKIPAVQRWQKLGKYPKLTTFLTKGASKGYVGWAVKYALFGKTTKSVQAVTKLTHNFTRTGLSRTINRVLRNVPKGGGVRVVYSFNKGVVSATIQSSNTYRLLTKNYLFKNTKFSVSLKTFSRGFRGHYMPTWKFEFAVIVPLIYLFIAMTYFANYNPDNPAAQRLLRTKVIMGAVMMTIVIALAITFPPFGFFMDLYNLAAFFIYFLQLLGVIDLGIDLGDMGDLLYKILGIRVEALSEIDPATTFRNTQSEMTFTEQGLAITTSSHFAGKMRYSDYADEVASVIWRYYYPRDGESSQGYPYRDANGRPYYKAIVGYDYGFSLRDATMSGWQEPAARYYSQLSVSGPNGYGCGFEGGRFSCDRGDSAFAFNIECDEANNQIVCREPISFQLPTIYRDFLVCIPDDTTNTLSCDDGTTFTYRLVKGSHSRQERGCWRGFTSGPRWCNDTTVTLMFGQANGRDIPYELGTRIDAQLWSVVEHPLSEFNFLGISYSRGFDLDTYRFPGAISEDWTELYHIDVLPRDLNDLIAPSGWEGLSSTDWDGDGLLSDSDPNDTNPDIDGDGIWDGFEADNGSSITLIDSDDDGLTDYQEAFLVGSKADDADSDDDGLTDGEELYYLVQANTLALDNPSQTMQDIVAAGRPAFVTSPRMADMDVDGFDDGDEQRLSISPYVPTSGPLLALDLVPLLTTPQGQQGVYVTTGDVFYGRCPGE